MALARIPSVTWVPLGHYQQGVGFDFRRLQREVIRPFRKKGRVRDLTHVRGAVVQHQGERKARGRTTGVSLLVLEGQHASGFLSETDADYPFVSGGSKRDLSPRCSSCASRLNLPNGAD